MIDGFGQFVWYVGCISEVDTKMRVNEVINEKRNFNTGMTPYYLI